MIQPGVSLTEGGAVVATSKGQLIIDMIWYELLPAQARCVYYKIVYLLARCQTTDMIVSADCSSANWQGYVCSLPVSVASLH